MRTAISFSGIDVHKEARLRELIGIRSTRIGHRLTLQPPDLVRIDGGIRADGAGSCRVDLRLRWPGADLPAEAVDAEPARAINEAFDLLERRLDARLSRTRHDVRLVRDTGGRRTMPPTRAPSSRPGARLG